DRFISEQKDWDAYPNADNSSLNPTVFQDTRMKKVGSTNEVSGASLNLDFDLGDYQLKSITAYRETFTKASMDLDGIPLNLMSFYTEWGPQHQWSQESQLIGSWGDVDWTTGLYYFSEQTRQCSASRFYGDYPLLLGPLASQDLRGLPLSLFQPL